jgi:hypothetical protein
MAMAELVLAGEQCCQEEAACPAALVDVALAKERRCHEMATIAAMLAEKVLTEEPRRHKMAAREKALANEAYKQCLAAMWKKALADKVNKQRRQVTAARENALANNSYERCYQELASVLLPPHRPTTYKDAVLSTMGGSLRAKSSVVAWLSHPSTTIDGQLQTTCRRSRPRHRVGRRHGPRAPNPQEHLLCGRQHRPQAPNQSTVNGWG